jgi:hypothetical protein
MKFGAGDLTSAPKPSEVLAKYNFHALGRAVFAKIARASDELMKRDPFFPGPPVLARAPENRG